MADETAAVLNGTGGIPAAAAGADGGGAIPSVQGMIARSGMSLKRKTRGPRPVFEAVFKGAGIHPESIPLGILTEAFSAIKRLACAEQPEEDGTNDWERDESDVSLPSIQLLGVRRGSAVYRFHSSNDAAALNNLRETGRILNDPERVGESDFVLKPIEDLSGITRRLGMKITLRQVGSDNSVLAKIEPDSYSRLSESLFIVGETSFMARIQRVGGSTDIRCALRVPARQRMLYCSVASQDVSRRLGEYLYEDVAVSGEAKWLKHNWKIAEFKITSVAKFERIKLHEAFRSLREAGGHGWDEIADPKAYLEEVCGK